MMWLDEHFERLKEERIASVRAAIALDNFWYYLWHRPDFAVAMLNVTHTFWGRVRRKQKGGEIVR